METTQQTAFPADEAQNQPHVDGSHQYAAPVSGPPAQAPAPSYPQYAAAVPAKATVAAALPLSAGMFGLIVVSTSAMGANLHRVQDGDMTMGEAVSNSLVKGAAGGIAAGVATAAATALTSGGLAGLTVTLATATGVSYLLNRD